MNGASGASDIEGKAALGSGERDGSRASFNSQKSNGADSVDRVHSVESQLPNSHKIYVNGKLHADICVPFREISLAPTRTMNGEVEVNEPVRVYDTSGPWGDPDFHGDVTQGLPPLRATWVRDRGDVEEYVGRVVRPADDGWLSEKHAASRNGNSTFDIRHSSFAARKPLRARAGCAVTQLAYARRGIVTPEMEFIAIRENHGWQRRHP
jgi:phosphomethylpyrimidine synthase